MLRSNCPAGPAGIDGTPQPQGGLIGAGPLVSEIATDPPEDHFLAALESGPDEDVEFIRQLFLLNRFM